MANTLTQVQIAYIDKIMGCLTTDTRFEALLAAGDLARGKQNELSSLDLLLICKDETYKEVFTSRYVFAAQIGGLLSAFPANHRGKAYQLVCLYGPELTCINMSFVARKYIQHEPVSPKIIWKTEHSDIENYITQTSPLVNEHNADWFELRAWAWLHECSLQLLRGELFEAISQLDFFRRRILGPMLQRNLGQPQLNLKEIDTLPEPFNNMLATTIAVYSRESIFSAIRSSIRIYLQLRKDAPPEHPVGDMPELLYKTLQQTPSGEPTAFANTRF